MVLLNDVHEIPTLCGIDGRNEGFAVYVLKMNKFNIIKTGQVHYKWLVPCFNFDSPIITSDIFCFCLCCILQFFPIVMLFFVVSFLRYRNML
jgi:hypothetical protein